MTRVSHVPQSQRPSPQFHRLRETLPILAVILLLIVTPSTEANHGGELITSIPYEYFQSVSALVVGNDTAFATANTTKFELALSVDLSLYLSVNVTGYSNSTNVPFVNFGSGLVNSSELNISGYLFCNTTSDCALAVAALAELNSTSCSNETCPFELTFAQYRELPDADGGDLTLEHLSFGDVDEKEDPVPLVIHAELSALGSVAELTVIAADPNHAAALVTALLSDLTDAVDHTAVLRGYEYRGWGIYVNVSFSVTGYSVANATIDALKALPLNPTNPLLSANSLYQQYTGNSSMVLALVDVAAALYFPPPPTYIPVYLAVTFDGERAVFSAWLQNSSARAAFGQAVLGDAIEAVGSSLDGTVDAIQGVEVNGTVTRLQVNLTLNVTTVPYEISNVTALRRLPYFALDNDNVSMTPQWLGRAEQVFLQGAVQHLGTSTNVSQLTVVELLAWGPDVPLPVTPAPTVATPVPTNAPTNASTAAPPTAAPAPTFRYRVDAKVRVTGNDAVFNRLLQSLVQLKAALLSDLSAALGTSALGISSITSGSLIVELFVNATTATAADAFRQSFSSLGTNGSWLTSLQSLYNTTATPAERASSTFALGYSVVSTSVVDRNAVAPPPEKSNNTALIVIVVIIVIIVVIIAIVCIVRMTMNNKKGGGRHGGGGGGGGGRRPKNEQYGQEFSMGPVPPRPGDHPV